MQRRRWDAKTKTRIILEGLRGRAVGELCNEHQIGQAQYYQWQKQFLAEAYSGTEPLGGELQPGLFAFSFRIQDTQLVRKKSLCQPDYSVAGCLTDGEQYSIYPAGLKIAIALFIVMPR